MLRVGTAAQGDRLQAATHHDVHRRRGDLPSV